ncbi:MAG: PIN domain-containing protein [Chthoniobacterales bacterium]|nr:PIN domain-containing protein [Chthoniobacterales bacterium]
MARTVLIDSGPLVAALRRRDQHHAWARAQFEAATEPFLTCESVVSECFFLLERARDARASLSALLERGVVHVEFSFSTQRTETLRLVRRYADLPMSFADACLVRMAEQIDDAILVTTDADFRIYRKNSRQIIPVVMPG